EAHATPFDTERDAGLEDQANEGRDLPPRVGGRSQTRELRERIENGQAEPRLSQGEAKPARARRGSRRKSSPVEVAPLDEPVAGTEAAPETFELPQPFDLPETV